jgi:hypothetical protein
MPTSLLHVARSYLGQQPALMYRALTETEVIQLEELRALYIEKTLAAARAPEPSLGVLMETRHLVDMLTAQRPVEALQGLEMPFKTD